MSLYGFCYAPRYGKYFYYLNFWMEKTFPHNAYNTQTILCNLGSDMIGPLDKRLQDGLNSCLFFLLDFNPNYATATALYTLGTNSWTRIDNPDILASVSQIWWRDYDDLNCVRHCCGVYSNEPFYWLIECCSTGSLIASFDMGGDVFRTILVPPKVEAHFRARNLLVQYEDSIALLEYELEEEMPTASRIHIWVMTQYD